jgi:carbon-monoxide dehydrogenase small subunit
MSALPRIGLILTGGRSIPSAPYIEARKRLGNGELLAVLPKLCGQGLCDCCTAVVNDRAVSGCLYLAAFVDGANVTTIESLARHGKLSLVQEAFIEADAFQCGCCRPVFIPMGTKLLDEHPDPDDETIKHCLTSNLCRCATYPQALDAVKLAERNRRDRTSI